MTRGLHIGADEHGKAFTLPADAVTQTFGILAVRGAGKSNTARRMAEQMYAAEMPFVAVDPVGAWWGLRSAQGGKSGGLSIPIFGGRHGDVPLERRAGNLIADLIVEKRLSCVLDLSEFDSEAAKKGFLLDFAVRLYRRNTAPLHLFLEEADDYIPQKPMRDEAHLLRAWENIVRRGRQRGLGITMISQRSACINKNVLTQVETLIAMRITSPQDRKAIAAWVEYHGQSEQILESLAELRDGEAWFWSPHWLGKVARVQVDRAETFDSGATPGARAIGREPRPTTLADVDLEGLRGKMAATLETAKANDPAELRRQLAEAKRRIGELERKGSRAEGTRVEIKRVEVPVLKDGHLARLETALKEVARCNLRLLELSDEIKRNLGKLPEAQRLAELAGQSLAAPRVLSLPAKTGGLVKQGAESNAQNPRGGKGRILAALAQHPCGLTADALGILTGLTVNAGTFGTYVGQLRSEGLIAGDRSGFTLTTAGRTATATTPPLPTGDALRDWWRRKLGGGGIGRMFDVLCGAFPDPLTRDALATGAGLTGNAGTFGTYLGKLRKLRLMTGNHSLKAGEELFG